MTNLVYQLVDQGLLERSADDKPVLRLNAASWEVMRGQRAVRLREPKSAAVKRTRFDTESWEGVDRGLFQHLRALRREIADERGVPPFVIFSDASLRDMARLRPASSETFVQVHGVGAQKLQDNGPRFLEQIKAYCGTHRLPLDASNPNVSRPVSKPKRKSKPTDGARAAFKLFARGARVEDVMEALGRARSTTIGYLAEYIVRERPATLDHWIAPETYRTVAQAAEQVGTRNLRPIFEHLDGAIPYDDIRLVVAHLSATKHDGSDPPQFR